MAAILYIVAALMGCGCLITAYMAGWYAGHNKYPDSEHLSETWWWFRLFGIAGLACLFFGSAL